VAGIAPSPKPGPAGNVESFLHLRDDAPPLDQALVEAAVTEGATLRPGARA
jgi:23S rRNA (cytidine1920-2'-O)/16S rRNA (cytidine1409-2'-O)-methyltransferase